MSVKNITKVLLTVVLVLAVYSFLPVVALYLSKAPAPYTNRDAVAKLKDNKGEYFEFIVFGDDHAGLIFNDSAALKIVRNINREDRFKKMPIDFVAVSGDVSFRGSAWDYSVYNKIRSRIKWPVISGAGNHDYDSNGMANFKKYIGPTEIAFADRNSYFIVSDNTNGDLTDEQFVWLEDNLTKGASYKHRFVILHKAPVSPYQQSWFKPEATPWAGRFMKLCEKHKVDIVFSGHEHLFKKSEFGGVKYITSGGGGQLIHHPDEGGGYLHYVTVRVLGDYVDYEVRRVFPPLWEYITYYMWRDVFYFLRKVLI